MRFKHAEIVAHSASSPKSPVLNRDGDGAFHHPIAADIDFDIGGDAVDQGISVSGDAQASRFQLVNIGWAFG